MERQKVFIGMTEEEFRSGYNKGIIFYSPYEIVFDDVNYGVVKIKSQVEDLCSNRQGGFRATT